MFSKALVALSLLLAPLTLAQNITHPILFCGKMHIIAARGHGTPSGYGGLNTTVAAIQAAIQNTTSYPLPYYTYPSPNYNFQAEVANATGVWNRQFKAFVESCPNTPVVLIGYSEGAVITGNALCGASSAGFTPTKPLNSSYASSIIATVLFGDETRTAAGQSYNLGTCQYDGGFPRTTAGLAQCAAFTPNFASWCDAPDPLCCNGNNATTHHIYPSEYNNDVVAFVQSKYASWTSAHPTPTTSAKSTVTKKTVTKSTSTSTSTSTPSSPPMMTSSTFSASLIFTSSSVIAAQPSKRI